MLTTFFSIVLMATGPGQLIEPPAAEQGDRQSLELRLLEANRALRDFRASWSVLGQGTEPNEKLMTLESVVTDLELDALGKEALWKQLQCMKPDQMPITPELQALLANDPKLAQYENDLQYVEDFRKRAEQQFGALHRITKQAEEQFEVAKQKLNEETAVKIVTFNNQHISQAQQSYLRSQEMLLKATDQLARVKAEQRDKDAKMAEYMRLLESRDSLRAQLSNSRGAQVVQGRPNPTVAELLLAVQRTRAILEQAQAAHGAAVRALEEAMAATTQSTEGDSGLDNGNPVESKPARESGN